MVAHRASAPRARETELADDGARRSDNGRAATEGNGRDERCAEENETKRG